MSTLKSVLTLVRYQPWFFLITCLAWGIFHSLPLVIALLGREVFDVLGNTSTIGLNVWTILALIVATSLSRVTVMVGGVWLWSTAYYTLASLIRRNIFDWIMTGPGTKKLPGSPGESVTRFRDDVHEVLMTVENWTDFSGIIFMLVGGIVVMANIDPLMALVAMAPLVGVLIFGYAVGNKIQRYRRATLEATGRITSFVGEVFGGVQAVKVAAAEEDVIRHFEKLNGERHDVAVRDVLFNSLFRAINTNMAFVGIGLVMLMVAGTVRGGNFNAGDFFLFTYFLQHLSWNMFFVGDVIAQHKRTGVSLERLREMTPDAPEQLVVQSAPLYMKGDPPDVSIREKGKNDKLRLFEARGLRYHYPSTGRGIEGIDLEIRRGEFILVTGKIGSGKTTLLRALLGLVEIEEGELRWNDAHIVDPAAFMTPPRVSYTSPFQRHAPGQHPDGTGGTGGGSQRSGTACGDGAGYRCAGRRTRHEGGTARREALRRTGAAERRSPDVRARSRTAGDRRSLQCARCGDRIDPLGTTLRAAGRDLHRRLPPAGRTQAGRQNCAAG